MPLRLYTNASGYGTQLRGGVLGRYGNQQAPRSPWALFFGAGGQPNAQAAPGGTYQGPPPQAEGAARAMMGRAVGSIVGATQDGSRLIVRGVDGKWYITDNQGVPVQQTTVQAAQQLVTSGQFKSWAGTVMPDGNIQWANMSPGDANAMALAEGVPDANGVATAPTTTANPSGTPTTGTVPAGMKFVGIAADGKTLIFTDSSGATHLYSRDPNTMQLTPISGTPKPTGTSTGTGTTTGTTPPTGTAPSSTTAPAATTKPAVTNLPGTSTEPGVTAPPPSVSGGEPTPPETPVGGTGTFSQVGTVTPGPTNYPGEPVSQQPLPDNSPSGTPSGPPSTLYDVLNAAPDAYPLTPEQIAALQSTPVDPTMFSPPDLASSEPASPPPDVPPPPVTGGGGGSRLM